MDLADFLLLLTGLTLLITKAKAAGNWKLLWPKTTGLECLWIVWISIVAIGLFINNPVTSDTLIALGEFRWILSFHILCFTLSLIDWNFSKIKGLLLILLLMTTVSFVLFPLSVDFRAGGPFYHSMPFSHTYGPAFVFSAGILLILFQNSSPQKWLAFVTTISTGLITALSMTRGIWIAMLVGTGVMSLYRSRRYGVILTAWLIVIFALIVTFVPAARERAFADSSSMASSDNQRVALLRGNFEIVKNYPLFGTGYSQNKNYLKTYYKKLGYPENQFVSHAHNQYLHFWAGTGSLGLLCYLYFLFTVLKYTILAYKKLATKEVILKALTLGSLGGQVCFMIASLTEANFSIAKNRYVFLLISAVGVSIYYRHSIKENFKIYQNIKTNS